MIFALIGIVMDIIYVLAGISAVLWLVAIIIHKRYQNKSKSDRNTKEEG